MAYGIENWFGLVLCVCMHTSTEKLLGLEPHVNRMRNTCMMSLSIVYLIFMYRNKNTWKDVVQVSV